MVFGDNVRARRAARALPRTPTQKERRREERKGDKKYIHHTYLSHHRRSTTHTQCDMTCTTTTAHTTHEEPTATVGTTRPLRPPRTNHHRHSAITQPCHKDTHPNQQCCDSEHNEGQHDARESGTTQVPDPSEHGDTTQPTTPAIQQDHHTSRRGGYQ